MSLIIATKTGEGIVIGADSLLTISGNIGNTSGVLNTYEHSNKIHNLLELPVAIAFWGIGHIGTRSVRSYILEFENSFRRVLKEEKENYSINSISEKLYSFINEEYEKIYKDVKKPILGMLIAGVKPEEFLGEIYFYQLPNHKKPIILREKENFGMNWFGMLRIQRLQTLKQ